MANITMDLQDFNALMALGTSSRGALFLDLYNTGRTKAGASTASGPDSVVIAPTTPGTTALEPTVVTRVNPGSSAELVDLTP